MTAKTQGLVVVGGGTGFIGSALVKLLEKKGYETCIISRKLGEKSMTWNDLIKEGLPKETSAVINLAGQNILDPKRRWTAGYKQNVYSSRVHTTKYLAMAIAKAEVKPKVFISASGVGYYPPSTTAVYKETDTGGDFDYLSRLCSDWEKASNLPQQLNVRNVIIRSGVVLGKDGGMIKQLKLPFYFCMGGPIGSGVQSLPWIHIEDIINLYLFSIENKHMKGVVNGVAPHIITNSYFTKAFAVAIRRPAIIPMPVAVLNCIFNKERAKAMTEGQMVCCRKAQKSGFVYQYPNIEMACKEVVS